MTTTFFQKKNTLNGANLEREIDQKKQCYSQCYSRCYNTTAASKGSFTTSNPTTVKFKQKWLFKNKKPSMRIHLMASIATKKKRGQKQE